MSKRRTLYQQLEAGLGLTVAEARVSDEHLFWRGGSTPRIEFHGGRHSVVRLLKLGARDTQGPDVEYARGDRNLFQICSQPNCCAPQHFGSQTQAVESKIDDDILDLVNDLIPIEDSTSKYASLQALIESVNPFYTGDEYVKALKTPRLPRLRKMLIPPPDPKEE
jgi:hypothetical protein